jgi:hypothetical protein
MKAKKLLIVALESRLASTIPRKSPLTSVTPRAVHGDIRTRAHRRCRRGPEQGRGVVDTVPGHGHGAPFCLEPLHRFGLLIREHLRDDLVDPQPARYGLRGRLAVVG